MGPSGEPLRAWIVLIHVPMAQHRVGGHSWVNVDSLGRVEGPPKRQRWCRRLRPTSASPASFRLGWGMGALSTLSLGFRETHGDLFPPPYHLAPIMADR